MLLGRSVAPLTTGNLAAKSFRQRPCPLRQRGHPHDLGQATATSLPPSMINRDALSVITRIG